MRYVADFLRNDIVLKVFPRFVLYAAGKLTSSNPIPGIGPRWFRKGAAPETPVRRVDGRAKV